MNLVIDSGNTRIKAAVFENNQLTQKEVFSEVESLKRFIQKMRATNVIASSVSLDADELISWAPGAKHKIILNAQLPLPIKNAYKTPGTLGVDRIAAVCGALEMFPNQNCLVIDAGTCITYELLEASATYVGGAISPGISMRFEAMHKFTSRLPLVKAETNEMYPLIGTSTETCMQSGVINGTLEELKGMISQYQSIYPDLKVIICGGDYSFFENRVKPPIFVAPDLVMYGLNRILRYNVEL